MFEPHIEASGPTRVELEAVAQAARQCIVAFSARCPEAHLTDEEWQALIEVIDTALWNAVRQFASDLIDHLITSHVVVRRNS